MNDNRKLLFIRDKNSFFTEVDLSDYGFKVCDRILMHDILFDNENETDIFIELKNDVKLKELMDFDNLEMAYKKANDILELIKEFIKHNVHGISIVLTGNSDNYLFTALSGAILSISAENKRMHFSVIHIDEKTFDRSQFDRSCRNWLR